MDAKPGLVQIAYDRILHDILTFQLKPGETVSDYQISKELGMSRTPVREAIRKLIYGSLVVQGNGKAVVADISAQDIQEITELRSALEKQAVEIILTRNPLPQDKIARMRELNAELQSAVANRDYRHNFEIEDQFHMLIVEGSGNKRIIETYKQHHLLIERARWLSLFYPVYDPTIKEHEDIIDALEQRDRDAAYRALGKHMESSYRHFSRVFTDPEIREAARFVASLK